jgi:hypothetical protein
MWLGKIPVGRHDDSGNLFALAPSYSHLTELQLPAPANVPGPIYNPSYLSQSKMQREADFSFGTADRGAARLQYISKEHCKENAAATTPGPGTYKHKEGKGIANSLGDAPAFRFGTAEQRVFPGNRDSVHVPGPGANDQSLGGSGAAAYTFAPHGSTHLGLSRHRDQQAGPCAPSRYASTAGRHSFTVVS